MKKEPHALPAKAKATAQTKTKAKTPSVGAPASAVADEKAPLEAPITRYVGSAIHAIRVQHHLTIADVALRTNISRSMLSKIENGQTSASLETLSRVAKGLGVSMSSLFRQFDIPEGTAQLIKNNQGMEVVRRGTKCGHTYHLLAYDQGPSKVFEPFLITMNDQSDTFPTFEHEGTEFIYMLEGQIEYRHGCQNYLLEPGDSFTFHANVPHGPERLIQLPLRFLSITVYPAPLENV